MVRHAKDPQRMYNYWRTAQTEKIALEPKAPFIVTAKNIQNSADLWKEANTRNIPYLIYEPDEANGGVAPQRNAPQMGSASMNQEIMMANEDLKGTFGIYDAGIGNTSNEVSGTAIDARKRESDTGTFKFIDNLTRAIRWAG